MGGSGTETAAVGADQVAQDRCAGGGHPLPADAVDKIRSPLGGECVHCHLRYRAGAEIYWLASGGGMHPDCYEAWVERKPSREDKRTKLLHLTKSGAALLREIMPSVDRAQARMLQPLKPADRKTLLALLTQLVDLNNEASRVPLRAEDALEHLGKSN